MGDTMLKDITDIALLQEVIERSQEKLQILAAEDEKRFAEKMRKQMVNIENDSFELGSSPPMRAASPIMAKSPTPVRSATPKKEISLEKQVARESVSEESGGETTSAVANKKLESKTSKADDEVPFGISDVLSDEEEEEGGADAGQGGEEELGQDAGTRCEPQLVHKPHRKSPNSEAGCLTKQQPSTSKPGCNALLEAVLVNNRLRLL